MTIKPPAITARTGRPGDFYLTEELARLGHDMTLLANGDWSHRRSSCPAPSSDVDAVLNLTSVMAKYRLAAK
jgi:hypothetical protein